MNSVILLLEQAAEANGAKRAIHAEEGSLTYEALRQKSRSIGGALLALEPKISGVTRPVLVMMKKTPDAIASFLGVLYSGNPYVPLDYEIPVAHLQKILANLSPQFLITDEAGQARLSGLDLGTVQILVHTELEKSPPNDTAIDQAVGMVTDSDPIYIIYTSGSTGVPKGVVIPHRGVFDYAYWVNSTFGVTSDTVFGNQSPFSFDNSVLDIYGALAAGATHVLIPQVLFQFPDKLLEYINETGISLVFFVPTVMISVANSGALERVAIPGLKTVIFAGEVMPNKQLNIWRKHHPDALYANLYGPTEITVDCTYYIVDREFADTDPLPIGIPCENMGILILTADNQPAQVGEHGELCVLGTGLALGYWGEPELTRRVFVQNPTNPYYDEPMYRTGDLAFWDEDGLIQFIGRKDTQIKLHGYRIELGEIETAVKNIEGVENACVIYDAVEQRIVAFVEPQLPLTMHKLRQQLIDQIPKYMFPSKLHAMEALPLTTNGKIDRIALKGMIENERN